MYSLETIDVVYRIKSFDDQSLNKLKGKVRKNVKRLEANAKNRMNFKNGKKKNHVVTILIVQQAQ